MDFKKLSILILILVLSLFSVNAYIITVTHSNADGAKLYYCSPKSTTNNCNSGIQSVSISEDLGSSPFSLYYNDFEVANWKMLFSFKTDMRLVFNDNNYYGGTAVSGDEVFSYDSIGVTFTPYLTEATINALGGTYTTYNFPASQFANQDLRNDICKGIGTTLSGNTLTVSSSLNPITKISDKTKFYAVPESLKKDYYYMKSDIKLNLYKDRVKIATYYPKELVNTEYQNSNNFTLLKPNTNYFTFDLPTEVDLETSYGYGVYQYKAYIKPIDLKCNFNQKNGLEEGSEFQITENTVKTFSIEAPTCQINQNFIEGNNVRINSPQISQKVFPFLKLTKTENTGKYAEIFVLPNNLEQDYEAGAISLATTSGLPNNYNNLFVNKIDDRDEYNTWGLGEIIFYNGNSYLSYRGNFQEILDNRSQMSYVQLNDNVNLEYDLETLRTYLENHGEDFGTYKIESYIIPLDANCDPNYYSNQSSADTYSIELKNPNEKDISCVPEGNYKEIINTGYFDEETQKIFAKCNHCEKIEIVENGKVLNYCTGGDGCSVSRYISSNLIARTILIKKYDEEGGDYDLESTSIINLQKQCTDFDQYEDGNNLNKIICNENNCQYNNQTINLPTPSKNNIKIYKQGTLVRTESVNPTLIALKASAIKKFKTVNQAQEFVDSSVTLMEQFNISKYLTYNAITNKTTVKIQLQGNPKNNLTLYQIIPKDFANKLNKINEISDNGQFIVLNKDPVIGWYFNDSESNEEVNYTLPGDNEGGTIIITQEPILFNEGELIINYRESSCNTDEVQLFTLSDLENSKINPTNSVYHVCLAHIDDAIKLQLNNNNNAIHIFNYTNNGNMSLINAPTSLDVSTDKIKIYWNVQYQEKNPDGTFSCLGSYNNKDSSTFGDCGYNPSNRIWLHLGEDITPPTTTLSYPYLAHKMKIQLNAEDFGSGVDKTFYCITGKDDDCVPNIETTNNKDIYVECSNKWGCVKKIKYYSTDIEGNVEPTKEYLLTLIEQGSACQSDCTAKPTPNRIIKDCINLNGCTFFGDTLDKQQEVAEKCHYTTAGTWVQYNDSTEIMCPNGPTRPAQFTQSVLKFWDSICDNIQTAKYPVLVEGQQVNMIFVYCDEN